MWIDERGSQVLGASECRRLLAVGAKRRLHGHLGVPVERQWRGPDAGEQVAPLVLPVDYAFDGHSVIVRVGEGLFDRLVGRLVAFQVDGVDDRARLAPDERERPWSVLVRGLATEVDRPLPDPTLPLPEVAEPGRRLVQIRPDVVTGRWLGPIPGGSGHPGS